MTCPVCGGDTTVVCTRSDCEGVYRRRECLTCGHKFYTTELESGSDDFNRLDKIARAEYKERRKVARRSYQSLRDTVNLLERKNHYA